MPTADSRIVSIRLRNPLIAALEALAKDRGLTLHGFIVELLTKEVKR